MTDLAAVQRAVDSIDTLALVWVETPSNAMLKITSVTDVCRMAKQVFLWTMVSSVTLCSAVCLCWWMPRGPRRTS